MIRIGYQSHRCKMPVYVLDLADDTQPIDDGLADQHTVCTATINPDLVGERVQVNTLHLCKLKIISPATGGFEQISQSLVFLLQGCKGLYRTGDFQQLLRQLLIFSTQFLTCASVPVK